MKTLISLILFALAASAQTVTNGGTTVLGSVDHSGATSTKPTKAGTTLPAACAVGELFYKTDATAGGNIYGCTATNTWTAQGGSYTLPTASGSVLGGVKVGSGLSIDGGGVLSSTGGGTINSGSGNGLWFPWGMPSYSPGGYAFSSGGTQTGWRYQIIVPAQMEFRAIHAQITTGSGTGCTGGTCGFQFAVYNTAMTSRVAYTTVATSGGTPNINATGGARFVFGGGSAVSAGVLTLPAGSYWLVASSDSTVLAMSYYGTNTAMIVAAATTTTGTLGSTLISYSSTTIATGNGGSFALNADISGATWTVSGATTPIPVVAFAN